MARACRPHFQHQFTNYLNKLAKRHLLEQILLKIMAQLHPGADPFAIAGLRLVAFGIFEYISNRSKYVLPS